MYIHVYKHVMQKISVVSHELFFKFCAAKVWQSKEMFQPVNKIHAGNDSMSTQCIYNAYTVYIFSKYNNYVVLNNMARVVLRAFLMVFIYCIIFS